ncbi:MAG: CDP-6-deoxy-delta-3,4-glucoseen reductase [Pseudomonadota bacterium]|nr:CDP-6-deoxy-delta-3,4-glucoseen reductase [Pseudomonadota bacterium]
MPHRVTIQPSDHAFTVEDGETVLDAALRNHIGLPYGCRSGACGTCKATISLGNVDYGEHLIGTLTDVEKQAGKALLCQAIPLSDLVIQGKEIGGATDIEIRKLPCRVEKIIHASHDVVILMLKLPANERMQYLAGQYIDILLKDGKRRSYSMANSPHNDDLIELHLRNIPGGTFSRFAFTELKEKAILRFEGPYGTFFLRDSDKPIIFLAGGTGFAPIKAVVEDMLYKKIERPMVLYWGVRSMRDIYSHIPSEWQQVNPHFTFIPVLSEPSAEDNWPGRTGLVHQAVLGDFADLSGYQVYACGAPIMIEVAQKTFEQRGLPTEEFFADSFTSAIDPKAKT